MPGMRSSGVSNLREISCLGAGAMPAYRGHASRESTQMGNGRIKLLPKQPSLALQSP